MARPTHPMSGEPIGVAPRKTREYRAMTRPRLSGSVRVWIRALALVFIVSIPNPVGIDMSAKNQYEGDRPRAISAAP